MTNKKQLMSARMHLIKARKIIGKESESADKKLNDILEYIHARLGGW